MVYRIVFTRHASRSLKKAPADIKEHIRLTLLRIQVRPFDFIEKMINHPYYKLRVGDYRLILDLIDDDLVVLVVEIGHRRNIYKRFG